MKHFKILHLSFIPLFFLTECHVWNFYPDPNDPSLSRFTSRGYNIASSYVNGISYLSNGTYNPLLHKDSTGTSIDTLQFTWPLYNNDPYIHTVYTNISFLLPVPQSFNKANFLTFNGQRFMNSVPFTIQDTSSKTVSGMGTLYFVTVSEVVSSANQKFIKLSGLFDGNIGDSVLVTKGRFDFEIDENTLNF